MTTARSMPELQVAEGVEVGALSRIIHTLDRTILVASVLDQTQLNHLLPLINSTESASKQGRLKWIGLTPRNSSVQDLLPRRGFAEVIPEPATPKSFFYKFEKLKIQMGQMGAKTKASHHAEDYAKKPEKEANLLAEPPTLRMMPELNMESDFWLLQGGGVKKAGDRWNVKLKGPKPNEGRWLGTKYPDETQDTWKWVMNKQETNPFMEVHGHWVFAGHRTPEFFNDRWWFVGSNPWLKFVVEESKQVIATKFRFDDRSALHISRDSKKARDRQPNHQEHWSVPAEPKKNPPTKPQEVQRGAPMKVPSDPWLFPRGGTHFHQGIWTVKLLGPSPADGGWTALENDRWKWTPSSEAGEELVGKKGLWIAWGEEPQFKKNIWIFSGTKPRLAFCNADHQIVATKFMVQEGNQVQMAAESPQAKQLLTKLKDSLTRHQSMGVPSAPQTVMNEVYRETIERTQAGLEEARKGFSFLTFSFQLSEWKTLNGITLDSLASRMCGFLSANWKGGRVELWGKSPSSEWKHLGSSDDQGGKWVPLDSPASFKVKRIIDFSLQPPAELGALVYQPNPDASPQAFDATAEMISEFIKPILNSDS